MITRRSLLASAAVAPVLATVSAAAQEATPGAVSKEVAVVYGKADGIALLLDVYRPPTRETPRPAVLIFHPGGFTDGDRSWMEEDARHLAEAGYVACPVGHRLFDGVDRNRWPAQLEDAQAAVRWLRANAEAHGVDPDRIGAYGYSSGANLAAHLGSRDDPDPAFPGISSQVDCVIDLAGKSDTTIAPALPDDEALLAALLGGGPDEIPEVYRDFSVVTHIGPTTAPTLVLHGTDDTWTPVEHARRLVAALQDADVEMAYVELAGVDHLEWPWAVCGSWMLAFLARQLRPEG